jgi:hypothetical protein
MTIIDTKTKLYYPLLIIINNKIDHNSEIIGNINEDNMLIANYTYMLKEKYTDDELIEVIYHNMNCNCTDYNVLCKYIDDFKVLSTIFKPLSEIDFLNKKRLVQKQLKRTLDNDNDNDCYYYNKKIRNI